MSIPSGYISASDLQSLFRDKSSGLPLRGGVIYFWEDSARSVPKNVYVLSGTYPNYSFVSIGSVVTLTAAGTFSDNGNPANDIAPYYFPYDGTPSTTTNTINLYYVEAYSRGGKVSGTIQFTRQAWPPNVAASNTAQTDFTNYVPNGQFLTHTDVPATDTTLAGQIINPITYIAQGGWTFERPSDSTAVDFVIFQAVGTTNNPAGNPSFAVEIKNTTPNPGDGYKDLRLAFPDVNKFASLAQKFTFAFWSQTNTGNSINVELVLIKNFGHSGSATVEIPLGNLTISSSYSINQLSFIFGINTGKTIGIGSQVQLAIRFPVSSIFDTSLTDFILTPNAVSITQFPATTDAKFKYDSLAGFLTTPNPDGSDLFLPVVMTRQGMLADSGGIGDIVSESQLSVYVNSIHPSANRLLPDGNQYETSGYSALGIPFSRLQKKYWNSTLLLPEYGTGRNYFTAVDLSANQLIITNNSQGMVTSASDNGTGFTISTIHIGDTVAAQSWIIPSNGFFIRNTEQGVVTSATAGTSGFSITIEQKGTVQLREQTAVGPIAAVGLAGKYFTFDVYTNGGDFGYYVWFKVDGVGADPMVSMRAGIEVDLLSTDSPDMVSYKVSFSLNGWQVTTVNTTAGSTITAATYFSIHSTAVSYYVWYTVDGVGTDPKPVGKTAILVAILSTDTSTAVAVKTLTAINMKYFATPDYRGLFFRVNDPTSRVDFDTNKRYSFVPGIYAGAVGTLQNDTNQEHFHQYSYTATDANETLEAGSTSGITSTGQDTTSQGNYESRPNNISINCAIIY